MDRLNKRITPSPSPLTDKVVGRLGPNMTSKLCREMEKIVRAVEYEPTYINDKPEHMCPVCWQFAPPAPFDADPTTRRKYGHKATCWLGRRLSHLADLVQNEINFPERT